MRYPEAMSRLLAYAPRLTAAHVESEPAWYCAYLERVTTARCAPAHFPDARSERLDADARRAVAEALNVVRLELMGESE